MTNVPDFCFFLSKEMAVPSLLKTACCKKERMRKDCLIINIGKLITVVAWLNREDFGGFSHWCKLWNHASSIALSQLSAVMLELVVLFMTVAVTMFVQRWPQSYEMNFLRVKTVFGFPMFEFFQQFLSTVTRALFFIMKFRYFPSQTCFVASSFSGEREQRIAPCQCKRLVCTGYLPESKDFFFLMLSFYCVDLVLCMHGLLLSGFFHLYEIIVGEWLLPLIPSYNLEKH